MVSVRWPSSTKARRDLRAQRGIGDRRAGKLGFRIARKLVRSDQRDLATLRIVANERAGIFARDCRLVPSTETRRVTDAAQAGLIAGTVPTNGKRKFLAQVGQHDG